MEKFAGGTLKFADLNLRKLEDFKDYLLTAKSQGSDSNTLSQNSTLSYFNKVKQPLNKPIKMKYCKEDLNAKIKPIKAAETKREYLTLEELNTLVKTPCKDQLLMRVALFSALTGLRFFRHTENDVGELEHIKGQGYF